MANFKGYINFIRNIEMELSGTPIKNQIKRSPFFVRMKIYFIC